MKGFHNGVKNVHFMSRQLHGTVVIKDKDEMLEIDERSTLLFNLPALND